jgi:formylglycine-generating enzyme required for sulfatase activity
LYSKAQVFLYGELRDSDEYYAKAAKLFQKAAGQGSAGARFFLGSMYFDGKGVDKDYIEAKSLIGKAREQGYTAEQGYSDIQKFSALFDLAEDIDLFITGKMIRNGGLLTWKAAEAENSNGIVSYLDGDYAKAAAYFLEAARYGNVYALRSLKQMYSEGLASQEGQDEIPAPRPPEFAIADILEMAEAERRMQEALLPLPFSQTAAAGMVQINGGTFMMGSPSSEEGREFFERQHQVTVSSFYMGNYTVTQKEWGEAMEKNPSIHKGDNLPVENVSWFDAVRYCNRRSAKEGLIPVYTINGKEVAWDKSANGYRLPTEAEWEYACRAGTTTPFNTGDNITTNQANYNGNYPYHRNAKGANRGSTVPIGSFAPNPWGLYDMHGNVWEWCWDWFNYRYSLGNHIDPSGPEYEVDPLVFDWTPRPNYRVSRGGSGESSSWRLRSASRQNYNRPEDRGAYTGFRLVRSNI